MTISPVIRLHPDDGVVIARASLPPGTMVADGVTTVERIPSGHKVAIKSSVLGEPVKRYGQIIGFATQAIAPGQQRWLRTLNIEHHQILAGTDASMAPGFKTMDELKQSKAQTDYWAKNTPAPVQSVA